MLVALASFPNTLMILGKLMFGMPDIFASMSKAWSSSLLELDDDNCSSDTKGVTTTCGGRQLLC